MKYKLAPHFPLVASTVFISFCMCGSPRYVFALMTSDIAGSHVAIPGNPVFGVNHDGIGAIQLQFNSGHIESATAVLLEGGEWVLTAGHVADPGPGDFLFQIDSITWVIRNPDGSFQPVIKNNIPGANVTIHDEFIHKVDDPTALSGYDIALIRLPSKVEGVPGYQIYRGGLNSVLNEPLIKVGFGNSGLGNGPATIQGGAKRAGINEWDIESKDNNGNLLNNVTLDINNQNSLVLQRVEATMLYDFDSGDPNNDVFSTYALWGDQVADLGWGDHEVSQAPGDSGGPLLIDHGGNTQIAGIMSWISRFDQGGDVSDFDGVTNASWGELGGDIWLGAPNVPDGDPEDTIANWILTETDTGSAWNSGSGGSWDDTTKWAGSEGP